jgi:hypothetical protein
MTTSEIQQKIQDIHIALSANPDPNTRQKLELGLEIFQSLLLAEQQKKTEEPSEKPEQLPTKTEMQEWARKEKHETNYAHVETSEQQPTYTTTSTTNLKTIKAPTIDREPEYINIELTDQKGAKYIRTYNRAQVKALCRKYFSNVHNAWAGGNRKLTNGFDNLLAYFLGWTEFDRKTPGLEDVLQDYFRYKKASEKSEDSEAFKVAKELYDKMILVTSKQK